MMNMGFYFPLGFWRALESQVVLWKNFYRPMGAAFYMPLYHAFGLNPRPFQTAVLFLLALDICLLFFLARALGCGLLVSGLAAFAAAYHSGMGSLLYNTDMVYDVLCFAFYIGALLYYVHIRSRARPWRWLEAALFLALFLCALNSKEIALTLPFVLAAYEWFFRRSHPWKGTRWVVVLAFLLDLLDLYGKRFGSGAIMNYPAYHPVFTVGRFVEFQKGALRDLLGVFFVPGWEGVLVIWLLVTWLSWRRDRPLLRFCWAYLLIAPLPIAFLIGRFQGSLYVPLAGWAIFGAVVFTDLVQGAAEFLSREPLFRYLGRQGLLALLVALGVSYWGRQMVRLRSDVIRPAAAQMGMLTEDVINQLRALNPKVQPKTRVVFLNDPFVDWDMTFIGMLWFGDRSVEIYTQRKQPLPPDELARAEYVFDFQNGKLVPVRSMQ
jgi:hypothetical protein